MRTKDDEKSVAREYRAMWRKEIGLRNAPNNSSQIISFICDWIENTPAFHTDPGYSAYSDYFIVVTGFKKWIESKGGI